MGFTFVEPRFAVLVESHSSASWHQAFKIWREREGLEREFLGFFASGSSVAFPALPQRTKYFVEGYHKKGSWKKSAQTQFDSDNTTTFRHNDGGGGDRDFDDLTVTLTKTQPSANNLMFTAEL